MSTSPQILTAFQTIPLLAAGTSQIWSPGLRGANGQLAPPTEVHVSNGCDWSISGNTVIVTNNTLQNQASVYLRATLQNTDELQDFPTATGGLAPSLTPAIPIGAKTVLGAVSEVAPLAANTLPSAIGQVNNLGLSALAGVISIPNTVAALAGVYEVDGAVSIANTNAAIRACTIQLRDTVSGDIYWCGRNDLAALSADSIPFHGFIEKAALQSISLVVELVPIAPAVLADFQLIGLAGEVALALTIEKIA